MFDQSWVVIRLSKFQVSFFFWHVVALYAFGTYTAVAFMLMSVHLTLFEIRLIYDGASVN